MIMHTDAVHGLPARQVATKLKPDGSIKSDAFPPGQHRPEASEMYIEHPKR